jgi:hypothetical protein
MFYGNLGHYANANSQNNSKHKRGLKEYSARYGLTQKNVISQALSHYMGAKAGGNDAMKLWTKLRKISNSGKQNINPIKVLRKYRLC